MDQPPEVSPFRYEQMVVEVDLLTQTAHLPYAGRPWEPLADWGARGWALGGLTPAIMDSGPPRFYGVMVRALVPLVPVVPTDTALDDQDVRARARSRIRLVPLPTETEPPR